MKTLIRAGVVAVGALGALALGMSTASAATTYSVSAGNAAAGTTVSATGVTQGGSPQVTFKDTTTNTTLTCASSTIPVKTIVGTGLSGTGLAKVAGADAKFNTCSGPLGLQLTVKGSGTWKLTATGGGGSQVTGNLTGIKAVVKSTDGTSCKFSVAGTVAGTYTNATQVLSAPGTTAKLKVSGVTGCFGLVKNGDLASYKADYKVTATKAAQNPIKITKP